jgi:hypothetical protein
VLSGEPPLYTLTRAGLRAAGRGELPASRVSPAGAAHAAACCAAAAALESGFPGHSVIGEPVIRSAFAELCPPVPVRGGPRAHRPDLALLPTCRRIGLPIAVEVELTVKAPGRLEAICRAWARHRAIAGVVYLAAAPVRPPLERAIARVGAGDRIVVLALQGEHPAAARKRGGGAASRTLEPCAG